MLNPHFHQCKYILCFSIILSFLYLPLSLIVLKTTEDLLSIQRLTGMQGLQLQKKKEIATKDI